MLRSDVDPRRRRLLREVQAHLDIEIARLVADGLSRPRPAARRGALRQRRRAQERFHEATAGCGSSSWSQDLRYGCRGLRKSPAFVATTVLTLAIGLALTTVVFTIFNAYVLRPFAVRDPASLHRIVLARPRRGRPQSPLARLPGDPRAPRPVRRGDRAETRASSRPKGRHARGGLRVRQLLRDAGAAPCCSAAPLGAGDARAPVAVLSHQAWAGSSPRSRRASAASSI